MFYTRLADFSDVVYVSPVLCILQHSIPEMKLPLFQFSVAIERFAGWTLSAVYVQLFLCDRERCGWVRNCFVMDGWDEMVDDLSFLLWGMGICFMKFLLIGWEEYPS